MRACVLSLAVPSQFVDPVGCGVVRRIALATKVKLCVTHLLRAGASASRPQQPMSNSSHFPKNSATPPSQRRTKPRSMSNILHRTLAGTSKESEHSVRSIRTSCKCARMFETPAGQSCCGLARLTPETLGLSNVISTVRLCNRPSKHSIRATVFETRRQEECQLIRAKNARTCARGTWYPVVLWWSQLGGVAGTAVPKLAKSKCTTRSILFVCCFWWTFQFLLQKSAAKCDRRR